jgi:F0F1-type ATP synthase gamma subunit
MINRKILDNQYKFTGLLSQVVNANKLIAITQLKSIKDLVQSSSDYLDHINQSVIHKLQTIKKIPIEFLLEPSLKKIKYIAIGSNQGFCGGLNTKIASFFTDIDHSDVYTLGSEIYRLLPKTTFIANSQISNLKDFCNNLLDNLLKSIITDIKIVFYDENTVRVADVLPLIDLSKINHDSSLSSNLDNDLSKLPGIIFVSRLFAILQKARLTENMERILIMEQASKNCNNKSKQLQTQIQKLRQQLITNEILQITSTISA